MRRPSSKSTSPPGHQVANIFFTHDVTRPVSLEVAHGADRPESLEVAHGADCPESLEVAHSADRPESLEVVHGVTCPESLEVALEVRTVRSRSRWRMVRTRPVSLEV